MEPHLYRAAMDGKTDLLRKMPDQFYIQATKPRIHSSTLHAVWYVNVKGETALHIAARRGHSNVVRILMEKMKTTYHDVEMGTGAARPSMRMANNKHNTACMKLHDTINLMW
ncbi:hypothetical protein POTOM_035760 [Populus tomentosa]|uniref:Ankyrin repeat family protein n=1 Tax=Populus tomentosa TaxID=118781 RepID=A0A8X7YZ29_POPTO|nr:hypothetical protein POTOM_035760 [Populus tomentosa]